MEHLYEISCGTYQPELARQYVTNMVNLAANANAQNNQSIQLFNQARSQAPVHVPCFFWDQVAPPGNWPAGQRWQPVRILVSNNVMHFLPEKNANFLMDLLKVTPNIPSRFTSTKRHCAVVAYVPVGSEASGLPPWHLLPPPPGQPFTSSPEVSRISMWICGPRHNNSCIPGARTTVNKTSTLMNYNRVYCSILVPMF